ncbi:MAG: 30S ribosomal protein S11 [Pseudomonadota bacterium]|nr:30S ribosomal protein S11 [Pseudomonadota bacterium]
MSEATVKETKEAKETKEPTAEVPEKKAKKKAKKTALNGNCHVYAGFGNTVITITDLNGDTVCWSSAGAMGFKGSRKGTPFAAQVTAEDVARKANEVGLKTINVYVGGPGAGREPAVRALASAGLRITSLQDVTPIPHNGCRPPKRRRI